jgi:hypothetical protein
VTKKEGRQRMTILGIFFMFNEAIVLSMDCVKSRHDYKPNVI